MKPGTLGAHWCSHLVTDHGENMAGLTCKCLVSCHATNKPKENPQQPETKACNKHATSEICLLPSPSYSKGRACEAQSQHKHFIKTVFAILWQLNGQYSRSSCEGFFSKNCCPPHALLHLPNLPNIHHPHLLRPLHHLHLLQHLLYITIVILIINIYLTYIIYLHNFSINLIYTTYIIYNTHTHIASLPTSSSISLHPLHYLHILYLHPTSLTTSSSSSTT